jgi:polyhydroxyalkanoate synthase subunit PhaC
VRIDLWELSALTALLVAVGALAVFAHIRFWERRLGLPLEYSSYEKIACSDGAYVELRRVPIPAGVAPADLPPVVLVHGVGANHRNQDAHPDYSLARYLAALGRDVWLPTLRCAHPGILPGYDIRFESMAREDVPRAIAAVRDKTGAERVDYVGFSMGGMLLYAALDRTVPRSHIRRVVIVGSPAEVHPRLPVPRVVRFVPRWLMPRVPFRFGARAFAFAAEWFTTPWHGWVLNPRNVAKGITRVALVEVIEDIPAGVLYDFAQWSSGDGIVRMDGEAVLPGLAAMDMPALFIAGSVDALAPPREVKHAFDVWGKDHPAVPKRFVILGRDYGSKEDYGHGDLALGVHVGVELFEPIARFLGPDQVEWEVEHDGPREGKGAVAALEERRAL